MATKIQMNVLNSSNSYELLHPETDYNILTNKPTITKITSGTTALTPNTSPLPTGEIYLMYE